MCACGQAGMRACARARVCVCVCVWVWVLKLEDSVDRVIPSLSGDGRVMCYSELRVMT